MSFKSVCDHYGHKWLTKKLFLSAKACSSLCNYKECFFAKDSEQQSFRVVTGTSTASYSVISKSGSLECANSWLIWLQHCTYQIHKLSSITTKTSWLRLHWAAQLTLLTGMEEKEPLQSSLEVMQVRIAQRTILCWMLVAILCKKKKKARSWMI